MPPTSAVSPILESSPSSFPTAFVHGVEPTSIDAGIYGFIANIHFFDIDTPLKQFVSSRQNLVGYCVALHERVMRAQPDAASR
jgi:hypothetical protein